MADLLCKAAARRVLRVSVGTPRILAIMGSGETAPTMVTPHREIVARLGQPSAARGAAGHAVRISGERVRRSPSAPSSTSPIASSSRSRPPAFSARSRPIPRQRTPIAEAAALSRLRTAGFVFAGPGSPSYALSVWRGSPVPGGAGGQARRGRRRRVLQRRGPDPRPLQRARVRDLQGRPCPCTGSTASISCAPPASRARAWSFPTTTTPRAARTTRASAISASGGWRRWRRCSPTTRGCSAIDEHTALIVDLDARTVSVTGRGGLTVRRRGVSRVFPAGSDLSSRRPARRGARGDDRRARPAARRRRRATRHRPRQGDAAAATQVATACRDGREARAGVRGGDRRAQGGRRGRGHADPRPHDPRVVGRHAADRRARSGARHAATRLFSGSARRRPAGSGTRASCWRRWSRASSRCARSCAPPRRGSSPTASRDRLVAAAHRAARHARRHRVGAARVSSGKTRIAPHAGDRAPLSPRWLDRSGGQK